MLNLFLQVNLILLLPLVIFGITISFITKKVSENLKENSKWWIYTLCGFIGTPIHEISHLIFHIIFLHKVKEVSLYRPIKSKKDGVLGFVKFTYSPKSIYQNIGLFFSGIGPMIGGSLVLYVLMKILLPDVFTNLIFFEMNELDIENILINIKDIIIYNVQTIFTKYQKIENLVIFLLFAFSITTHMSISFADLKSAITGGIIIELLILISSILLEYYKLTKFIIIVQIASAYLISFLVLGLIFSLISMIISYLISLIPI